MFSDESDSDDTRNELKENRRARLKRRAPQEDREKRIRLPQKGRVNKRWSYDGEEDE